jgi:hypothetical protein
VKLPEAVEVVHARSLAAVAGPSGRMTPSGSGNVSTDAVAMLLHGVGADADEVLDIAGRTADSVMAAMVSGEPPRETVAGAIVEAILLGALVGMSDA